MWHCDGQVGNLKCGIKKRPEQGKMEEPKPCPGPLRKDVYLIRLSGLIQLTFPESQCSMHHPLPKGTFQFPHTSTLLHSPKPSLGSLMVSSPQEGGSFTEAVCAFPDKPFGIPLLGISHLDCFLMGSALNTPDQLSPGNQ